MARERRDLKKELFEYALEYGLYQKIPCSKEENREYRKLLKEGKALPDGVYLYEFDNGDSEFYTVYVPEMTEQEINQYLTYKKLDLLSTIKNCVVFFTVITIIGMMVAFLFAAFS